MTNLTPLGNNTYRLEGVRRDSVTNRFKVTPTTYSGVQKAPDHEHKTKPNPITGDNMVLTAAETAAGAIIRSLPPETVERLEAWLDNALSCDD